MFPIAAQVGVHDVVEKLYREIVLVSKRGHPLSGRPHNLPG